MSKALQTPPSPEAAAEVATAESAVTGREMMEAVLAKPSQIGERNTPAAKRIDGVVIGQLSGFNETNQPLVTFAGIPGEQSLPAISTSPLAPADEGREVALSFVGGDPSCPVILGLIQKVAGQQAHVAQSEVKLDDERLVLTADREIVLKCGKSSITLTRAGKIIIKGAYLSNYSTGVNRIKGGSVQIN